MHQRINTPRATTIIELVVYLALLATAIAVTSTLYINSQTTITNTTGNTIINTALINARHISNTNNHTYPTNPTQTLNNLNKTHQTPNYTVKYTNPPLPTWEPNTAHIATQTPNYTQIAFATYTGNTCWLALDNITTHPVVAYTPNLDRVDCTPEKISTCSNTWSIPQTSGTPQTPYRIPKNDTCLTE